MEWPAKETAAPPDQRAAAFRDASFDLVLAAFSLSHLTHLADGLAEARRVGRALAASSFAPGWTHPARDAVDDALRPLGYRPPPWYGSLRAHDGSCPAEDPAVLEAEAQAAGYSHVTLRTVDVATGLSTPAQLASWRLGMAHLAPFVGSLDSAGRVAAVGRPSARSNASPVATSRSGARGLDSHTGTGEDQHEASVRNQRVTWPPLATRIGRKRLTVCGAVFCA